MTLLTARARFPRAASAPDVGIPLEGSCPSMFLLDEETYGGLIHRTPEVAVFGPCHPPGSRRRGVNPKGQGAGTQRLARSRVEHSEGRQPDRPFSRLGRVSVVVSRLRWK